MLPLSKPYFDEKESAAVQEVLASGWVTQGPQVQRFEEAFAALVGANFACAVSNCTTGLHLALQAVGVKPGNLVITVSHSYIATANAIRHCNAEPLFVDIDPATYNMCPTSLLQFLETNTQQRESGLYYTRASELVPSESPLNVLDKTQPEFGKIAAVLIVHQIGMPADMERLLPLARQYGLPMVEDAACAIGSEIQFEGQWKKIGYPLGDVVCFSFHPRKVLTTGDGGMITTNHAEYDQQFRLLRQHGMSVPDTVRHGAKQVIVESYLTTGYNFRMTDIQAAVGIEQLRKLPAFTEKRRMLDRAYREVLQGLPWVSPPYQPDWARSNWQSYAVRIDPLAPISRDELMQRMLDLGIATKPGIMNAHQEMPYRNSHFELPLSEAAREQVMLLPLFHAMTEEDVHHVGLCLKKALQTASVSVTAIS